MKSKTQKEIIESNGSTFIEGEPVVLEDNGKPLKTIQPNILIKNGDTDYQINTYENNDPTKIRSVVVLDNTYDVNRIIEMDEQGKPQFTEEAIKDLQEHKFQSHWPTLRKKWTRKKVIEGTGKFKRYIEEGIIVPRSKGNPSPRIKNKTEKTESEAQRDRTTGGARVQTDVDKKIKRIIAGKKYDYIQEPNGGKNFPDQLQKYNPHLHNLLKNGHPNFFGEIQDIDSCVANPYCPIVPVNVCSTKKLIKESATNLIKDMASFADMNIPYVLVVDKPGQSLGWIKPKSGKRGKKDTAPRKCTRMFMQLKERLAKEGKDHLVNIVVMDTSDCDPRLFSEAGYRKKTDLKSIMDSHMSSSEKTIAQIAAPQKNESLNDRFNRVYRELDILYARSTMRGDEVEKEYAENDKDYVRDEAPISTEIVLKLIEAYDKKIITKK